MKPTRYHFTPAGWSALLLACIGPADQPIAVSLLDAPRAEPGR